MLAPARSIGAFECELIGSRVRLHGGVACDVDEASVVAGR